MIFYVSPLQQLTPCQPCNSKLLNGEELNLWKKRDYGRWPQIMSLQ